jgi:hypothetical protein
VRRTFHPIPASTLRPVSILAPHAWCMGATPHPNCGEQGSGAEFAWHPSAQIADAWLVHLVDFANDIGELSISCQVEVKASKLAYEMLNLYSTPHASNTHGNLYIIRDLRKPSSRVAGFPLRPPSRTSVPYILHSTQYTGKWRTSWTSSLTVYHDT